MDAPCTTDGKRCAFTTAHTVRPQGYVAKADGQRFALPTAFADGYYTAVTTADIYIYFFIGRALGARVPPCGWETHLHMIPPHVSSVCIAPRSASPVFLRRILPAQLGSGSSRRGCPVNPLRAACPPSGATFCVGCPYPPCGVPLSRVPAGCTDGAHKYRPRD